MKEQSFAFGDEGGLVGTVCLPSIEQASRAHIGLVLFNAGVVHRIGPHRLNVRLARRLAARGIPSIRFDLSGQGDSARSHVTRSFEEQAVEDLRAAMGLLCSVAKVPQFALFGFCSGGVNSYAAAKVDERVAGWIDIRVEHHQTGNALVNFSGRITVYASRAKTKQRKLRHLCNGTQ